MTGRRKGDCVGGCMLAGWGGSSPYLAEIPTTRVNPPFVPRWIAGQGDNVAPRITQFSMDRRKGDALSARNEFSAEVRAGDGLGLDYRGWMGDTRGSWRERRKRGGVRKPKLSANVKFSVTIQLFAPLGRCDSEFDVKRSVLSGASGRRSFRGSACLHLPLRQIQRCRDLNPARPGCSNFSLLGHFS